LKSGFSSHVHATMMLSCSSQVLSVEQTELESG